MTDSLIRDLQALEAAGFTGKVTLHFRDGTVKEVEKNERWKPAAEGPVQLSEVRGEGVGPDPHP